jgi:hypothetical protein
MSTRPLSSRRQAFLVSLCVVAIGVTCAGLAGAAALVPAPPVALPFVGMICVGCPLAVLGEARSAIAVLLDPSLGPLRRRHLGRLRRDLDRLPETEHPLER